MLRVLPVWSIPKMGGKSSTNNNNTFQTAHVMDMGI